MSLLDDYFSKSPPNLSIQDPEGGDCISLYTKEKAPRPYASPLLMSLEYQDALEGENPLNPVAQGRSLNVTPARINQYLRLLQLPEEVKKEIFSGR